MTGSLTGMDGTVHSSVRPEWPQAQALELNGIKSTQNTLTHTQNIRAEEKVLCSQVYNSYIHKSEGF